MAVIKRGARILQFIDDDGRVFQVGLGLLAMHLAGKTKGEFVVLTRMPIGTDPSRFPPSKVFGSGAPVTRNARGIEEDAFSPKFKKQQQQKKAAEDKQIEW